MIRPETVAWMHHGYGYHPGFAYHAYGGGSWITYLVVSSVIHGLIYSVIFRVLRHLSLGEVVLLVVIVIGLLYAWNRRRGYQWW